MNSKSIHISLRVTASATTLTAALLMAFDRQAKEISGFLMKASFNSSPAFQFFVIGNAVACASLLLSIAMIRSSVGVGFVAVMDLMCMGLAMAASSAATAIGYLGKKGNAEVGWTAICQYFEAFCYRASISLFFSYLGVFLLFILCSLAFVSSRAKVCREPPPGISA